ncbi:hypothetical protein Nepgr_027789 [Nepenthes gracilis]|uniref:catalase n=1 Tax=Nepenthes gracilis TaxID=150966 RepID=A0AAD3TB58_NEPGR|nr:hypothetical protein Nepgr_027789 [Nepenthes gracilis]
MSNGIPGEHLDGIRGDGFELTVRLDINIDVTHTITYLHTYTKSPSIHRDIKALNVLLLELATLGGKRIPDRFSTIFHEPGSPEILQDPHGFVVPCYTREGTVDLVGNNFLVFFICSSIQLPDMVYSFMPNPKSHIQDNWRIVDFYSYHPASSHMFPFPFDDVGVSQDYRHMKSFGVNTYTLINTTGEEHSVIFL